MLSPLARQRLAYLWLPIAYDSSFGHVCRVGC